MATHPFGYPLHIFSFEMASSSASAPATATATDSTSIFGKCFVTGKLFTEADLGVCLYIENRPQSKNYKGDAKKLPEITILPYYVSRIAFNKGIEAKEAGTQAYILRFPDGSVATHWLPLYIHDGPDAEHWTRSADPKTGTRVVKKQATTKPKHAPTNYYLLLDHSGSMQDRYNGYNSQCLRSILDLFNTTIDGSDFVSLTTFDTTVKMIFPLLQKSIHADKIVKQISEQNRPDYGTAFFRAIHNTLDVADITRPITVVALTDGKDNDRDKANQYRMLIDKLKEFKTKNIRLKLLIITVGTLSNSAEIEAVIRKAPAGSQLIKSASSTAGIADAYEKVKKLIVSKSGGSDEDVLGTSDFLPSAFSLIVSGENGKFDENDIWRVCARLLNLCVVNFSRKEKALDEQSLQIYCDISRTLIEMLKENPAVLSSIKKTIASFMDQKTPNERRREMLPDLGEAIQLLALIDDIKWVDFGKVYIQEIFPSECDPCSVSVGHDNRYDDADKVKYYWEQFKVSMLLTIFNVRFVEDIVHAGGRTITEACTFYHNTMRYATADQLVQFVGKIEDLIRSANSFGEAMKMSYTW